MSRPRLARRISEDAQHQRAHAGTERRERYQALRMAFVTRHRVEKSARRRSC